MNRKRRSQGEAIATGLVSGVVGGLIASYVMSQFQAGLAKLAKPEGESGGEQEGGDDATVKMASAISETRSVMS